LLYIFRSGGTHHPHPGGYRPGSHDPGLSRCPPL